MTRFSFSSLRVRLLLLVLIAVIPALGLIHYTASKQREQAARDAQEDSLKLVRALSAEHERLIESGHQLLVALAKLPQVLKYDSDNCSNLFSDLIGKFKAFTTLAAAKPNGGVFCSSTPGAQRVNFSDRPYFQQVLKTRAFTISEFVIGRLSGKPILTLSYPSLDDRGDVRAVLVIGLDLSWFHRIVSAAQLPEGSNVTVIDRRGVILARDPDPENLTGKSAPEAFIAKTVLARHEGTTEAAGLDGVPRLYVFTSLRGVPEMGPVYVWAGIPKKHAFAEVDRIVAVNLAGLGFVVVLMLGLAWTGSDIFVLRRINALVNATKRLSTGELGARAGEAYDKGELGQLARSFDEMAESLEKRYRQMKALHEIDLAISSTLDLRTVLDVLLEKTDRFLPYSVTTVRLLNKETGELESFACRNLDEKEWKEATARSGGGLARMLPENNAPVVVRNAQTDPRSLSSEFVRKYGLISFLRVPLTVRGGILGVLTFFTKEEHEFTNEEIEFLTTLAGQAAIAIYNSQLYEQMKCQAAELAKSNKVKDEFLSVMSHELRTPLNVVMGYTQIVKDGMFGEINPKQEEALSKVILRSRDLLDMIDDILHATSIEAKSVKVERCEVNLHGFLDNLRTDWEIPLNKKVSLIWNYPPNLPVVKIDSGKLKHILQNLIGNAIKFTAEGHVVVTAQYFKGEGILEFKVADTGVGIPEEALPVIFEKFRQADSSETRSYGGAGVGLYIVKKFTELLGARVGVASEPGKGSVFTVSLPVETVAESNSGVIEVRRATG